MQTRCHQCFPPSWTFRESKEWCRCLHSNPNSTSTIWTDLLFLGNTSTQAHIKESLFIAQIMGRLKMNGNKYQNICYNPKNLKFKISQLLQNYQNNAPFAILNRTREFSYHVAINSINNAWNHGLKWRIIAHVAEPSYEKKMWILSTDFSIILILFNC